MSDPSTAAPKAKTVKIRMTSYNTGEGYSYAPGDIGEFDEAEAARLVKVGGAEALPVEKAEKPKAE